MRIASLSLVFLFTLLTFDRVFGQAAGAARVAATLPPHTADGAQVSQEGQNPLLDRWAGPYGGVPPLDRIQTSHFAPAVDAAGAEMLGTVERIVANPAPPTFENTIAALEAAERPIYRVSSIYSLWQAAMDASDGPSSVPSPISERIASFYKSVEQNNALFRRVEAVYNSPAKAALTPEQQRLTWWFYNYYFVRTGAPLDAQGRSRLAEIDQLLKELRWRFDMNMLEDYENHFLELKSADELVGLPQSLRDNAARAGGLNKKAGSWLIRSGPDSVKSFLTYSGRRDLREKAWKMFVNTGNNGGRHDNNAVAAHILQLRAERARLLGYPTYAHFRLENRMAKTPERAMELLEALRKPAASHLRAKVAVMQDFTRAVGAGIKIEPWDYLFYARKMGKLPSEADRDEARQYLEIDKLREGMFWIAGELFDLNFKPAASVPVYAPDVSVWEVTDAATGRHVGLWYFDPYLRINKRGTLTGVLRRQERVNGEVSPIVCTVLRFGRGRLGEPTLLSWDEAEWLFGAFGGALYDFTSNVNHPTLSGAPPTLDSEDLLPWLFARWLATPEFLQRFALHHETGKPIPQALVERVRNISIFDRGFATATYLPSAFADMRLHLADARKIDPGAFEQKTLAEIEMPLALVTDDRPPFGGLFSNDGYAAGYYSPLWRNALVADTYAAFGEAGGPFDRAVAARLRRDILSVGAARSPADSYRAFRGRELSPDALLRELGFTTPEGGEDQTGVSPQNDAVAKQVSRVANKVKKAIERDVKELKVKRVRVAAPGQAERVVEAYEARAVSNVLAGNKTRLLQGLPGKRLEGLRDYVETEFPSAELPNTFRAGATTYVERQEAEALLSKAVEVVGVLDIGEDKVKLNITSTPNDAIFKLVNASGVPETACTKPCSITVPRGNYTYEITRKGYQPTKNSLPLMHKKPYVTLECELVREGEEKDPPPCRIEDNQ